MDRIKKGRSGDSGKAVQLTPLQKWKKENWAFISPYIKKRKQPKGSEMGKVSICNNLQIMFTLLHQPSYVLFSSLLADSLNNLSVVIAYASVYLECGEPGQARRTL